MAMALPKTDRLRFAFEPAGDPPVEVSTLVSAAPEPTRVGDGPARLARVTLEVLEPAVATDLLHVGATGHLSFARPGGLAHDYGWLEVTYNQPTYRPDGLMSWTICLEPPQGA